MEIGGENRCSGGKSSAEKEREEQCDYREEVERRWNAGQGGG